MKLCFACVGAVVFKTQDRVWFLLSSDLLSLIKASPLTMLLYVARRQGCFQPSQRIQRFDSFWSVTRGYFRDILRGCFNKVDCFAFINMSGLFQPISTKANGTLQPCGPFGAVGEGGTSEAGKLLILKSEKKKLVRTNQHALLVHN